MPESSRTSHDVRYEATFQSRRVTAGLARCPGAGQRAQPATRGCLFRFGEREGKALGVPARSAPRSRKHRHPCNGAKPPDALRARKCASGRPAMREARVPAGQDRKRRTLRSAQRGTECVLQLSRLISPAPDRHPAGPGPRARSAPADRAGCPAGQPGTVQILTTRPGSKFEFSYRPPCRIGP